MSGVFKKVFHISIFIICVCLALCLTLSACNETSATTTLTFIADGKVVTTLTGEAGSAVSLPPAPEKENFDFVGWFDDAEFGEDAKQATTVMPDSDVTYYAKYVERTKNVGYTVQYYLQKLSEDGLSAIDEYELGGSQQLQGQVGSVATAPDAEDNAPQGYVFKHNQNEALSLTLDEDETKNVLKVYYDRAACLVRFDANGGEGEMEALTFPYGATVSPNGFENMFTREGWRFVGFVGTLEGGEAAPTVAFAIKTNVTFSAQWHRGFKNAADANDVVYFDGANYYRLNEGVRETAELTAEADTFGYDEFVFGDGESEKVCRVYAGEATFAVRSDEFGSYVMYSYIARDFAPYILSLDGFGIGAYTELMSGGASQSYRGDYALGDDGYDDWMFEFDEGYDSAHSGGFYFDLQAALPDEASPEMYAGSFVRHGDESGEFVLYSVRESELYDGEMLWLYGDGNARIVAYDAETDDYTALISQGIYYGTANYEDALGEWEYLPTQGEAFRFVLGTISGGNQPLYIYMQYDETLDVELSEEGGNGKLTIGGYNGATYTPTGGNDAMSGAIEVLGANVLRFVPYENGIAREPITFGVNWTESTFTINTTGLAVDENGVLTGYFGTSTVIAIPDNVTAVAEGALSYNKINTVLKHITIPASVKSIGARAFENYYSLMSVVFESETPIDIDWSDANDPFRWPARGAFKIFVPDSALDAYREAWADCSYTITSVFEDTNKPEFEIDENGVLISYNCKKDEPEELAIVLPPEVLSVGAGAFRNIAFIASVDLNNATSVGASAFEGCEGLTSVKADNLETIGEAAFALCTSLTSINLPKIKTISAQAFAACEALEKVQAGASIERIGDRAFSECATFEFSKLFVLELADGAQVPIIGDEAFYGCYGYRVSVATLADALALYDGSGLGWTKYAGRASVRANENGELAGDWVDVCTLAPATAGGRFETNFSAYTYSLSGEALTLYYYSYSEISGQVSRGTVNASYKDGRISFEDEGVSYVFVKREGKLSYTATNGEQLVIDLDTYNVEEIEDSEGYASTLRTTVSATFEGQEGEIIVSGNSPVLTGLTLASVTIEGKEYKNIKSALTLKLTSAGTFTYTTALNDVRGPYTAADGSYINLVYHGTGRFLSTSLCMTGCIKQFLNTDGDPIVVESLDTWSVTDIPAEGTFMFVYYLRSDRYYVTVTLDEASKTFTYSAEKAASRVVLSGVAEEKVVALLDKDGKTILSLSLLLPDGEGGTDSLYVRKFTLDADGGYTVEAEQRQMVYDEATGGYVTQLGPLSGVYKLTLDFDKGTCTVSSAGPLPSEG